MGNDKHNISRRVFIKGAVGGTVLIALAPLDRLTQAALARSATSPGASGNWSDKATWGGVVPGPTDDVIVPVGVTVTLDTDANVRSLTVNGTLKTRPTKVSEYRESWAKLGETASAGSSVVMVHGAKGWRAGDRLVLTPTSRKPSEFDDRTIKSVSYHAEMGHYHIELTRALTYTHEAIPAPEIDRNHHAGKVQFAGEVLNMTRRLNLLVATEVLINGGRLELDDLYVNTTIQMSDCPQGGVLRRVVGELGKAGQFQTENTQNLLWEECVAYDYTTVPERGGAGFGWSETTGKGTERANGIWAVKCVAAAKRSPGGSLRNGRTKGFVVGGLSNSPTTKARGGIVGCVAVGCPGGTEGPGIRFQESADHGMQFFWRNEAHSCGRGFYIDGNNMIIQPDGFPFVTAMFWRNTMDGMFWGSYGNRFEMHHFHFLGNGQDNVVVQTKDALWGRFVLDGEDVTRNGVRFTGYITPPHRYAEYLRTKFRNHTNVAISLENGDGSRVSINKFIDFPEADFSGERVPRTDFCQFSFPAFPQKTEHRAAPLVREDILRFDDMVYTHSACANTQAPPSPRPWTLPTVDQVTGAGGTLKTITAPGSRYTYQAFVARIEEQPHGGKNPVSGEPLVRPLEDWTMVDEVEQSSPNLIPDAGTSRRPPRG